MNKKIVVRLFYESACGCSGCGSQELAIFEVLAERLIEKFGLDNLRFEAYNAIDDERFPHLRKTKKPIVSVGEKVVSSGKLPQFHYLEKEVERQLQEM